MAAGSIGEEEFEKLVRPLVGLEVSLPWKGYGTAIFLELGALKPYPGLRADGSRYHETGEASIKIEWDWRIETRTRVLYGSSDSRGEMADGIATLQGCRVTAISVSKGVPELRVIFSNGQRLRTMVMTAGDPQWSIRFPDGQWLWAEAGRLYMGDGEAEGMSEGEMEADAIEEAAADRWGKPRFEPAPGNCRDCRSFVCLDGHFWLLDYGCCTAAGGPFDGRTVHADSGCPSFSA